MPRLQGLTADIPADLAHADQMLTKYGRWIMDRIRIRSCGSAEGKYKPPANETVDDDARREPREMLLPTPEAMALHRAYIRIPALEREVLDILYVPKLDPTRQKYRSVQAQLRLRRIPGRLCQERHLRGLRMFANLMRAMA